MYKSYDDLPEGQIKKRIAQYAYDYFFHYLLIQSSAIRTLLCQYLAGDDSIALTTVENCESYSTRFNGKKLIMDVVAKDEQGRYFNIEMQMGDITEDDEIRFASYLNRLIESQEQKGKDYRDIKDVYQLIVYMGRPMEKFKHYEHEIRRGDFKNRVPLNVERTHTKIIQIRNMEGDIDMEARMSPIDQLMYLIGYNRPHKYSEISDIMKEAMDIHEKYMKYDEVIRGYELERERMLQSSREGRARDEGIELGKELGIELGKEEGIEIGKELGIEVGKEEGRIETMQQNVNQLIESIYGNVDTSFIYECTYEQLQRAFSLIKKDYDYDTFKIKIKRTGC